MHAFVSHPSPFPLPLRRVCNPADAEMEVQVGDWLAEALGLGARFTWAGGLGAATIQPSATEAMVVVARAALDRARRRGLLGSDSSAAVAYVSEQAHFCTAKGCAIVGIGHVRKIPAPFDGRNFPMDTRALAACMAADVEAGLCPVLIGVSHGTTGTCAFDDAVAAAALAAEHKCWLGVDAAYAGTAAVCPEKRTVFAGWELADSLVINGSKSFHLLLGSTFLFVANRKDISPSLNHTGEYLKTGSKAAAQSGDGAAVSAQAPTGASAVERDGDFSRPAGSVAGRASDVQPVDLKDFNLGLGRPWRSLKIWLQLRIEGLEPVRATIRRHHAYAAHVAEQLLATPSTAVGADDRPTPNQQQADASRPHVFRQGPLFELPTEPALGLVTFRLRGFDDAANARFLARLNAPRPAADGAAQHDLFLVEARAGGRMLLRIAMASPVLSQGDIDWLLALIRREARAFVQEELRGSA